MEKHDFFDRSPVRIFDDVTDGGLKAGELGLVTSKKGLGKTSVLVQFGMDALIDDRHLVHVSFDQHSSNVIAWYESIFSEIAKKKNIANADEIMNLLMRNRTILNFSQETFTLPKVIRTLKALKEGGIAISDMVIDGIDFSKVSASDMDAVKDFVKSENLTAWFSATAEKSAVAPGASLVDFAIAVHLAPQSGCVFLDIVKCHEKGAFPAAIRLDSKTLLMVQK